MTGIDIFVEGEILADRYRIRRLVGKGGVGEVYEAQDLKDDRRVAVKTLMLQFVESSIALLRFERESEYSRRIDHPGVLRIYEVFKVPVPRRLRELGNRAPRCRSISCMSMEFLEGETIADRLIKGKLFSTSEALPLVCQVAAALGAAHRAGVVHRDLKPDNMFVVSRPGEEPRMVVTDFGVARQSTSSQDDSLTASNVLLGTPSYMAPEQLELEVAMPASDIYALGLVMFEMLTGKPAFYGETPIQMVFKRVKEAAPSARIHLPDLDGTWERAIARCLARDPKDRYPTADNLVQDLDGPRSRWLRQGNDHRRRRRLVWGLVLAGLAAAVAATLALL